METGHCSNCGKIWTLEKAQGVCQWCGKSAICQTTRTIALRIKSRSNGRKRQVDDNHNGNGYHKLDGDYALFYKVGKGFTHRVMREDREDFLHDLFLAFARVKAKYDVIGKALTEAGLIRVASYQVSEYWRKHYKITNGLDCGYCSTRQRRKCREEYLYSKCPKYKQLISLDTDIEVESGDKITLAELIADDKAIDLDAKLDARCMLRVLPKRLKQIGYKRYVGFGLDSKQQECLRRYWRKISQKTLL